MASPPRKTRRQSTGRPQAQPADQDWQVTEADFAKERFDGDPKPPQAQDAVRGENKLLEPTSPEAADMQAPVAQTPEVQDQAMMTETVRLARDEAEARMKGIFQMVMQHARQPFASHLLQVPYSDWQLLWMQIDNAMHGMQMSSISSSDPAHCRG